MCPGGTTDQDITLLISPKKGQCGVLLSQTNLLKLDRVQNEAMPVILGTTKDTPHETLQFMLDLPLMQTRQTESETGQSIRQCCRKSPQPTP